MFPHGVVTQCYNEGKFCLSWKGRNHKIYWMKEYSQTQMNAKRLFCEYVHILEKTSKSSRNNNNKKVNICSN